MSWVPVKALVQQDLLDLAQQLRLVADHPPCLKVIHNLSQARELLGERPGPEQSSSS